MEILNTYQTYTNAGFIDVVFIIVILGIFFFGVGVIANLLEEEYLTGLFFLIITIALGIGAYLLSEPVYEKHTEYEVIIEDYNEVHEQGYEIVETRGEITVIKKIEEDE